MPPLPNDIITNPSASLPDDAIANPQAVRTPADASLSMQDAQWAASHPYLRALQNIGNQTVVNPGVQAINAVAPALVGAEKAIGAPVGPYTPIQGPDMSNAPLPAKVLGDVAGGAAQGGVAALTRNPVVGYGALAGLGAYGENRPVIPAVAGGMASAIPQMIAGNVGGNIARKFMPNSGFAPRIGTAIGMGGAGAAQAAVTGGNPVEAAATGATFGAISPMGGPHEGTQEDYDNLMQQQANIHRTIQNPSKGIINDVEIKNGKDLDDLFNLAAREKLVYSTQPGNEQNPSPKLDNRGAIAQLQGAVQPHYDQLNQILDSNKSSQFDLEGLKTQIKSSFDDPKSPAYIKNATDANAAKENVDSLLDDEIARNGRYVSGSQLNTIKQGMWGKSYNPLAPNSNDTARQIGFAAKGAIEQAYPDANVAALNAKIGQYLSLQKVLEKTNGQIIQGGKIGNYVSKAMGAGAGAMLGSHIPIPGVPEAALFGGGWLGGKFSNWRNDPTRITQAMAQKANNFKITNPIQSTGFTPKQFNAPQAQPSPIITPTAQQVSQYGTPNAPIPQQGFQGQYAKKFGTVNK